MDYQFEVSEPSVLPAVSMRTRTPVTKLPQVLAETYGAIYQYLLEIGEEPAEAAYTAYYNMDMNDLDVEIGFIVNKPLPGRDEIKASKIPDGKQVSCMYKGPYNQMEPVYKAMNEWMTAHDYSPTGVAYEFYYNDPSQVPESELLTKIMFPVQG